MNQRALSRMLGVVGLCAGCQTPSSTSSAAVFQNPSQFVGREVSVCGNLIGPHNLLQRRGDLNAGLSIDGADHARELAQLGEYARVCLSGTLRYIGCDSDPEIICTEAAFDYMIRVKAIL